MTELYFIFYFRNAFSFCKILLFSLPCLIRIATLWLKPLPASQVGWIIIHFKRKQYSSVNKGDQRCQFNDDSSVSCDTSRHQYNLRTLSNSKMLQPLSQNAQVGLKILQTLLHNTHIVAKYCNRYYKVLNLTYYKMHRYQKKPQDVVWKSKLYFCWN